MCGGPGRRRICYARKAEGRAANRGGPSRGGPNLGEHNRGEHNRGGPSRGQPREERFPVPGMNTGLSPADPMLVAAFRSALLHQGAIALLIVAFLWLLWATVWTWRLTASGAKPTTGGAVTASEAGEVKEPGEAAEVKEDEEAGGTTGAKETGGIGAAGGIG